MRQGQIALFMVKIVFAANREKLCQCRLDVTGFIDCAALNNGRLAVPVPRKPEGRVSARVSTGSCNLRLTPASCRHRPRTSTRLILPRPLQAMPLIS